LGAMLPFLAGLSSIATVVLGGSDGVHAATKARQPNAYNWYFEISLLMSPLWLRARQFTMFSIFKLIRRRRALYCDASALLCYVFLANFHVRPTYG
jgi:hypothetical protein